ncbi:uncharacterized protein LOC135225796 [Macrobrachium nipponense]|uniref:uncharacterized protein LOC135225796 n=1 Tax=Macrobrachium nipponense TaxID=159736 RepID=UPI0030C80CA7
MDDLEKLFQIFLEDEQLCIDFAINEKASIVSPGSPELYLKTVVQQPQIRIKECTVYLRNFKTMSENELQKCGVYNLRKKLREYEKLVKLKKSVVETESKLRGSRRESSFNRREAKSEHKSLHKEKSRCDVKKDKPSRYHNSSELSRKNKFSGSEFNILTYKISRCKVKNCKFKEVCIGYHNSSDRRRDPAVHVYRPILCKDISYGSSSKCPKGDTCPLSHSSFEVRYHPNIYKMYNCKAFKEGYCEKREFCEYIHKSGAEPLHLEPKETESKIDKVSVGTVAVASSVHLHNTFESQSQKGTFKTGHPFQEMPVMCGEAISSVRLGVPQLDCNQTSFNIDTNFKDNAPDEPSCLDKTLSSFDGNMISLHETHSHSPRSPLRRKISSKREKLYHCSGDDLFFRCFESLMIIKDLLCELGEWISRLYSKAKSEGGRNDCMVNYLSTKENTNFLYKIYKLLSSLSNSKEAIDNVKIRESRELVKRLYRRVKSLQSRKLYLGLDINSLADQTLGQNYETIFKNVWNTLNVTGKPKVESVVITNICKKIVEKQSKIKLSHCKIHKNSKEEILCISQVKDCSKKSLSDGNCKAKKYVSSYNQSMDSRNNSRVNLVANVSNTAELLPSKQEAENWLAADGHGKEVSQGCSSNLIGADEFSKKVSLGFLSKRREQTINAEGSFVPNPPSGNYLQTYKSDRILSKPCLKDSGNYAGLKKVVSVLETSSENAPKKQTVSNVPDTNEVIISVINSKTAGVQGSFPCKENNLKYEFRKSVANHIPPMSPPETLQKVNISSTQSCKSSVENVSTATLKCSDSDKLVFLNDDEKALNSEIQRTVNSYTICGVSIEKMIQRFVTVTSDLTYTQVADYIENFFKCADSNVDRKIFLYICREVCNRHIKQQKNELSHGQNDPFTNSNQKYSSMERNVSSFSDKIELSSKKELSKNRLQDDYVENLQADLNIPLLFPSSKKERKKNKRKCGDEDQVNFSKNSISKLEISEDDRLRSKEWEALEISEHELSRGRKNSPIYISDSSVCDVNDSPDSYCKDPQMIPDVVILPNSSLIERKSFDSSGEPHKLRCTFSSRLEKSLFQVGPHYSAGVSKRKIPGTPYYVTNAKRAKSLDTFETYKYITIPSSPEENLD